MNLMNFPLLVLICSLVVLFVAAYLGDSGNRAALKDGREDWRLRWERRQSCWHS
jgi:hypothetical protein